MISIPLVYATGMEMTDMTNPFLTPDDAKRKSVEHVAKAATQINDSLAAGNRMFNVPIGIAEDVAAGLREAGWSASLRESVENPDNLATVVVKDSV